MSSKMFYLCSLSRKDKHMGWLQGDGELCADLWAVAIDVVKAHGEFFARLARVTCALMSQPAPVCRVLVTTALGGA